MGEGFLEDAKGRQIVWLTDQANALRMRIEQLENAFARHRLDLKNEVGYTGERLRVVGRRLIEVPSAEDTLRCPRCGSVDQYIEGDHELECSNSCGTTIRIRRVAGGRGKMELIAQWHVGLEE